MEPKGLNFAVARKKREIVLSAALEALWEARLEGAVCLVAGVGAVATAAVLVYTKNDPNMFLGILLGAASVLFLAGSITSAHRFRVAKDTEAEVRAELKHVDTAAALSLRGREEEAPASAS